MRLEDNVIITDTGCWKWQRAKNRYGYGVIRRDKKNYFVHRLMYEEVNGPIPEGMKILHVCDQPACCNPEHLKIGTQADNIKDAVTKGRIAKGNKHWASKLTDDDVDDAKGFHKLGWSNTKIALYFGVDQTTISKILNDKRNM